jgi:hypothetical protein
MDPVDVNGSGCTKLHVPALLSLLKATLPGDHGTFIHRDFVKFLIDRTGVPCVTSPLTLSLLFFLWVCFVLF